jgi:hypothetical protein
MFRYVLAASAIALAGVSGCLSLDEFSPPESAVATSSVGLVGSWTITHGAGTGLPRRITWTFHPDQRYELAGGNPQTAFVHETGTYAVQGNQLLIRRESGSFRSGNSQQALQPETRVYAWRIGPDPVSTAAGEHAFAATQPTLFLTDGSGQQEFFYRSVH